MLIQYFIYRKVNKMKFLILLALSLALLVTGCQNKAPSDEKAGEVTASAAAATVQKDNAEQAELDRRFNARDHKAEDLKMKRLIVAGKVIPPKIHMTLNADKEVELVYLYYKSVLHRCFSNALADDQELQGSFDVTFMTDASGKTEKAEFVTDIKHEELLKCYQENFNQWKFPSSKDGQPATYKAKLVLTTSDPGLPKNELTEEELKELEERLQHRHDHHE